MKVGVVDLGWIVGQGIDEFATVEKRGDDGLDVVMALVPVIPEDVGGVKAALVAEIIAQHLTPHPEVI